MRGSRKPAKSFFDRPRLYPVCLDMIPLLDLQTSLDGSKELFYFKGKKTELKDTVEEEPIETELGGKIGIEDKTGEHTVVEYGSPDPKDETRFTQAEIFEDVISNATVENVNVKSRGIEHTLSSSLGFDVLDGVESIWHGQEARSNKSKRLRRTMKLPLKNWYHTIKAKLLERGVVDKEYIKNKFKYARSGLISDYLLLSDGTGYDSLKSRKVLKPIERELVGRKFWKDVGIPEKLKVSNHGQVEGSIYRLDKEGYLIGI